MALSNLPGGGGSGSTPTDDEDDQEDSDASSGGEDVARGRRRARDRMVGFDEGEGLGSDDGDMAADPDDQAGLDTDPFRAPGTDGGSGQSTPEDGGSPDSEPTRENDDQAGRDDDPFRAPGTDGGSGGTGSDDERDQDTTSDDGGGSGLDYSDRTPTQEEMESGGGSERGTSETRSGSFDEPGGTESVVVDASTASQARAQATQATGLSASELDITEADGGGFRVAFASAETRAARQLDDQLSGVDVGPGDVEAVGDGEFRLTESARERAAAERAADEFDITRSDLAIENGRVVPQSEAGASAIAEATLQDRTPAGTDVDSDVIGPGVVTATGDIEGVREVGTEGGADTSLSVATPEGEEFLDQVETFEDVEAALRSQARDAQAAAARGAAENNAQAAQSDLDRGNLGGDAADRVSPEDALTREINTETGAGLTAGDVEAVETGDDPNQYEARLTESGREKLETELETEAFTAKVPDSVPFVGGASTTLKGQARDVTVESEDGALDVETQEQFGDIDWSFGLGGPEDEVEQTFADVGQSLAEGNREVSEDLFAEDGFLGDSLVAEGLDAAGKEDLSDQYETNLRSLLEDAYSAPGGVADMAANLPFETAEFTVEAGTSPIETSKKVPATLAGKGAAAGNFAAENPARFTGGLLGSAAVTGGLFKVTAGTRLGTATRYALQPGEELAKSAARSGAISKGTATKVPGVRSNQFDADSGSAAARASDAADEARRAIQQSTPDVSLVNDPDAGLVDVTPAARSQLRNTFTFDPPSVRSGLSRRIQATRERAATQFEAARLAGSSTLDTARNFNVDAAAADVANAVDAAGDTIAGTAKGAAFSAEASAFNARRALRDADLDDLLPSRDSDALLGPAQGRLRGLGVDANLAARRAANADLEDLTPDLPSFTDSNADVGRVRGSVLGASASLEAGSRRAARRARDTNLDDLTPGFPSFADSDADVGRLRGSLFGASASVEAAARRAASADASDLLPVAPDLTGARDLTLRVEPTRPPRTPLTRTVDANEVELTDSEAEVFDDVDTLTNLDDADANAAAGSGDTGGRINNAPDVEVGAGGNQRALMRTRSERNQRRQPVAELETEIETDTTLGPGMAAEIDPEPFDVNADLTATGTESLTGDDTLGAAATSETVANDLDDALGVEATGFETSTEVGVGFETGAATDTETETFPFEAAATGEVTAEAERERETGLETPAFELESDFGAQDTPPVFDDDGRRDDTASDVFENPTISPEQAVDYDPFGDSKKKSENVADEVSSDLDDLF